MIQKTKRHIGVFLALTLLFGLFNGLIDVRVVMAANPLGLTWERNDYIANNLVYNANAKLNNQILLSWNFGTIPEGDSMSLTYHLADQREAVATITKGSESTKVDFQLFNYTVVANVLTRTAIDISAYEIYTTNGFVAPNLVTFPPGVSNVTDVVADPTTLSFIIPPNSSLSTSNLGIVFRLKNNDSSTVRFMWQKTALTEKFYYSVQGALTNASFFDFTLTHLKNPPVSVTQYINMGADGNVKAAPFDEKQFGAMTGDAAFATAVDWMTTYIGNNVDQATRNDPNPASSTVPVVTPTGTVDKPTTGVYVNMPLPRFWDSATASFLPKVPDGSNLNVSMALQLPSSPIVTVNSPLSNTPIGDAGATTISITDGSVKFQKLTNNTITLAMRYLNPSTLYNGTKVYYSCQPAAANPNIEVGVADTVLPDDAVYTYLSYGMVDFGSDNYVIEVIPYHYVNGVMPPDVTYSMNTGAFIGGIFSADTPAISGIKGPMSPNIPLLIPTTQTSNAAVVYKILFNPSRIESQYLAYIPTDANKTIGMPKDLNLSNVNVVNAIDSATGNVTERLSIDLEFILGSPAVFDKLSSLTPNPVKTFTYHFYGNLTPNATNSTADDKEWLTLEIGAVYEADGVTPKKDANGNVIYTVKSIAAGAGAVKEKAMIDNNSGIITKVTDPITGLTNYVCKATVSMPTSPTNDNNIFFWYPGLYYVTMQSSFKSPVTGNIVTSNETVPVSLAVNAPVKYGVPSPANLTGTTPVTINNVEDLRSISVNWTLLNGLNQGVLDYEKFTLNPQQLTMLDNGSPDKFVYYNMYVSTSRKNMDDLLKLSGNPIKGIDAKNIYANTVDTTDYTYANQILTFTDKRFYTNLRTGDVQLVEKIPQTALVGALNPGVIIRELDPNQTYYFVIEAVVVPSAYTIDAATNQKVIGASKPEKTDISRMSFLLAVTTRIQPTDPNDDTVPPRLPDNFDKKDVTLSSATVFWSFTTPLSDTEKATYQFEVLRIQDKQLFESESVDNTKDWYQRAPLKDIMTVLDGLKWNTSTFDSITGDANTSFEYSVGENIYQLKDKGLFPNQVYFYYLRVAKVPAGSDPDKPNTIPTTYSVWLPLSLTTLPVQTPSDLTVIRAGQYDKYHEIVIQFNTQVDLTAASTGYSFQYTVKPDGGVWTSPADMPISSLVPTKKSVTVNGVVYYQYTYKITGLKQGTSYAIQVRMGQLLGTMWIYSGYSNIATTKTDIDPEEAEKDKETNDWKDYLANMLQNLRKQPYWTLAQSPGTFTALYRTNMFDGELSGTAGADYLLGTGSGLSQTYYLPSAVVNKAIAAQKNFKVSVNGMTVNIPAAAFDSTKNLGLTRITNDVKAKTVADYYIRVTVATVYYSGTIDGNSAASPRIDITVDAIGSLAMDAMFDNNILNAMLNLITAQVDSASNAEEIRRQVVAGTASTDVIKYLNSIADSVSKRFMTDATNLLTKNSKGSYAITDLPQRMLVTGTFPSGTTVAAYQLIYNNNINMPIVAINNTSGFYTTKTGAYVFTGRKLYIPALDGSPNAQYLTELITKYGLDELFGRDAMYASTTVTNNMVVGTVARILGASKNADTVAFLNARGITASSRTLYNNINSQDSVFYLMNLYAQKTNTKLANMRITNMARTNGLTGIDSQNLIPIRCAFEIGMISDGFSPNSGLNLKSFLDMLAKLGTKVKLM